MLVSVMVISALRFQSGCSVYQWGINHWGLFHCNPSEYTHGRHMCLLVLVCGQHQECTKWLLLPLLEVGGSSCY